MGEAGGGSEGVKGREGRRKIWTEEEGGREGREHVREGRGGGGGGREGNI
jgi:hypothetical protein